MHDRPSWFPPGRGMASAPHRPRGPFFSGSGRNRGPFFSGASGRGRGSWVTTIQSTNDLI